MTIRPAKQIQIPRAFQPLFEPKRYKTYYGGRGGAKSGNFARALLVQGKMKKLRILCAREIQGSIQDSVHKLLSDIIGDYDDLDQFYDVQKATIIGKNGTEFIFKGLKHNVKDIKSTEGVDICWVEEAENVSDSSWEVLIPTIRKEGSEIWTSFNPNRPSDPTYRRLVVQATNDNDMLAVKVSYRDNPFFPEALEKERLKLKKNDPKAYDHIWEGNFDERQEGYIYANVIKKAREQGRITTVPHKVGLPAYVVWDLGKRHSTSIWFAQVVGLQVRVIDFYEVNGDDADIDKIAIHLRKLQKDKEYYMPVQYLPHDGGHKRIGMKGSIKDQLQELGFKSKVIPVNLVTKQAGIQLGKNLMNECVIDNIACKDGLHALENYHYEWDDNRQRFKDNPFDDWSCDASDAWRYLSVVLDKYGNDDNIIKNKPVKRAYTSQVGFSG